VMLMRAAVRSFDDEAGSTEFRPACIAIPA
jgi:hypothetical protein